MYLPCSSVARLAVQQRSLALRNAGLDSLLGTVGLDSVLGTLALMALAVVDLAVMDPGRHVPGRHGPWPSWTLDPWPLRTLAVMAVMDPGRHGPCPSGPWPSWTRPEVYLARGVLARGVLARGVLARGVLARGVLARGVLARGDPGSRCTWLEDTRLEDTWPAGYPGWRIPGRPDTCLAGSLIVETGTNGSKGVKTGKTGKTVKSMANSHVGIIDSGQLSSFAQFCLNLSIKQRNNRQKEAKSRKKEKLRAPGALIPDGYY